MESLNLESFSPKEYILIKGARVHNLRNIDVVIPKNKLTVITGLSGSGKSSLAFETLYAEGQRRYVESLSAYARQFLGKLDKPEVDWIQGIAPAIAIQQKVNTRNPRSTVGISTEIYDYLKLFFARVGTTYSPISGVEVRKNNPEDVWNAIAAFPEGTKLAIAAPLILKAERSLQKQLEILTQQGYSRLIVNNEILRIEDIDPKKLSVNKDSIDILIDRISASAEDSLRARVADGIETAFYEGQGTCYLYDYSSNPPKKIEFNNRFEADGMQFEVPTINLFSFNNPYGACKTCEGFGWVLGIDEDLVVPDKSLSVYEGAIACWKGDKLSEWKDGFIKSAAEFDFPIHRSYAELSDEQKDLLWNGNKKVKGINEFFNFVESQSFKIQYRVLYSRFRGRTVCPDCRGTRLRKDASYVKVAGKSISDIVLMQVEDALEFIKSIELTPTQAEIAKRLLVEIQNRLQYLCDVGLGYLTLNRRSNSLSGGESQRIHLATSLGSALVGSMYILDEPSIGLHSKDTERLIEVVKKLRDLGNTVIIVEHDEDVMKAADHIIDIG
ncbi:MAG TPA: excinuclease ABC subunit A, partial [Bacteroidia bacterium]